MTDKSSSYFSPKTLAILTLIQALFPVLAALATAVWAIHGFMDQQTSTTEARILEARKPYFDRQLSMYFDTSKVIGELITLEPASAEWRKAKDKFNALYWSELPMVESFRIESASVEFMNRLEQYQRKEVTLKELQITAYCLSRRFRDTIEANWYISADGERAKEFTTYSKNCQFRPTVKEDN